MIHETEGGSRLRKAEDKKVGEVRGKAGRGGGGRDGNWYPVCRPEGTAGTGMWVEGHSSLTARQPGPFQTSTLCRFQLNSCPCRLLAAWDWRDACPRLSPTTSLKIVLLEVDPTLSSFPLSQRAG